jgi:hypothetical protein
MKRRQPDSGRAQQKGDWTRKGKQPGSKWERIRLILREILAVILIADKVLLHSFTLVWSVISIIIILHSKIG